MIAPFLLATFVGTLSAKFHCVDYSCKQTKRYINQKCIVTWDGENANVLGVSMRLKPWLYGATYGFQAVSNGSEVSLFFRPRNKMLRAYVIQPAPGREYDKWVCEFGREKESEWPRG